MAKDARVTALVAAITGGDMAAVRELLREEPSLAEARDDNGLPVLLLALFHQQRAHGVEVATRDRSHERRHALVLGHQRTIPQTRSATSLVNAARRLKAAGFPREVSEKATVPASIRTR